MGEAGAFPIATRSLSRWMLPGERGFAQGITHAGSRLGAALTPPLVVLIITRTVAGGVPDFSALLGLAGRRPGFSTIATRRSSTRRQCRRARSDPLRDRRRARTSDRGPVAADLCEPYAVVSVRDVFLLQLLPLDVSRLVPHLSERLSRYSLKQMGFYASLPLLAGTVGDLVGGWISDILLRATANVKRSRRVVAVAGFLIAAPAILPATLTQRSARHASLQLHRVLRSRNHGGRFLGDPARYRRRLRRFGFVRDEHVR